MTPAERTCEAIVGDIARAEADGADPAMIARTMLIAAVGAAINTVGHDHARGWLVVCLKSMDGDDPDLMN